MKISVEMRIHRILADMERYSNRCSRSSSCCCSRNFSYSTDFISFACTNSAAWAKAALAKPAVSAGAGTGSNPSDSGTNKVFENLYPQDVPRAANTIPHNQLNNISNKNLAYVVLEDGTLIVGRNNMNQGHIDLAQGKPVIAAGEVGLVNGKIDFINNKSGHYQPQGAAAQKAAEDAFKNIGIDVNGKYMEWEF